MRDVPNLDLTRSVAAAERTTQRPGKLDALGIALLSAALLLLSVLQSRHRMFWGDEIMGSYVLNAGSWSAFLQRWHAGIDSSGFWFYVFAKPWEWIFGDSAMRLRLFSATCVCTSAGLIWLAARRFFSLPIVAVSVSLIFLDIGTLRWQLSNARGYGFFMAAAALVLFLIFRGEDEAHRHPSLPFLLGTFVAYDLLAGSQILGMLYAGALLAMQIALDIRARRLRYWLYAAACVGIVLIVLFSLPNIRSTTAVGKPSFWTLRPMKRDLLLATDFTASVVRDVLFTLFVVALLQLRRRSARTPVYLVLLGFAVLDVLCFAISRVSTSIYAERYLLPFVLALVLLCAELLTQIRDAHGSFPRLQAAAPLLVALWGLYQLPPVHFFPYPQPNYTDPLLAQLPPGLPVVDTDVGSFVEVEYYHHGHFDRPFLFPLDPAITLDPSNRGGVSGFHEMDNFQRLGLDMPDLQPTAAILQRYPDMLVMVGEYSKAWFSKRIVDSDRYTVRDLGLLPGLLPVHLWEVRQR